MTQKYNILIIGVFSTISLLSCNASAAIYTLCLFHDELYETIPVHKECSFNVRNPPPWQSYHLNNKNFVYSNLNKSRPLQTKEQIPHDPSCFEVISGHL